MACVWATARDVTRLFQPIICAEHRVRAAKLSVPQILILANWWAGIASRPHEVNQGTGGQRSKQSRRPPQKTTLPSNFQIRLGGCSC